MGKLSEYVRASGLTLLENESLAKHTTFKIGGPAKYFITAEAKHLPRLFACAHEDGIKTAVIGKGSNILALDAGFNGLVITIKPQQVAFTAPDVLTAGGGTSLAALSMAAQNNKLAGMEFAMGIPGTVGGAVVMNAGAYDGEISLCLQSSAYIDMTNPQQGIRTLAGNMHDFSYRHSYYSDKPQLIITEASFRLKPGSTREISEKMLSFSERRKEKQPLEYPSAGSTFKRPQGNFAGKLIEEAGLRGYQLGGAQISEKHSGFIINTGGATAADVLALMEKAEKTVFEKTGITLQREIRILE